MKAELESETEQAAEDTKNAKEGRASAQEARRDAESLRAKMSDANAHLTKLTTDLLKTTGEESKYYAAKHRLAFEELQTAKEAALEAERSGNMMAQERARIADQVAVAQEELDELDDDEEMSEKMKELMGLEMQLDKVTAQQTAAHANASVWSSKVQKLEDLEDQVSTASNQSSTRLKDGIRSLQRFLKMSHSTLLESISKSQKQLSQATEEAASDDTAAAAARSEAEMLKVNAKTTLDVAKKNSDAILQEAKQQVHAASVNQDEVKTQLRVAQARATSMQASVAELEEEESQQKAQVEQLEEKHNEEVADLASMQKSLPKDATNVESAEDLTAHADTLSNEAKAAEDHLAMLAARLEEAEQSPDRSDVEIQHLVNQTKSVESKIQNLRSRAGTLRATAAERASDDSQHTNLAMTIEQAKLDRLDSEKSQREEKLKDIETSKQAKEEAAAEEAAEALSLSQEADSMGEMIRNAQQMADVTAADVNRQAKGTYLEQKTEADHAVRKAESAEQNAAASKAHVTGLTSVLEFLKGEMKGVKTALAALSQAEINQAALQHAFASSMLEHAQQVASTAQLTNETAKLAFAGDLVAQQEQQLQAAEAAAEQLARDRISALAPAGDAVKAALKAARMKKSALDKEVKAAQSSFDEANQRLDAAKGEDETLLKQTEESRDTELRDRKSVV